MIEITSCPRCHTLLPARLEGESEFATCPHCHAPLLEPAEAAPVASANLGEPNEWREEPEHPAHAGIGTGPLLLIIGGIVGSLLMVVLCVIAAVALWFWNETHAAARPAPEETAPAAADEGPGGNPIADEPTEAESEADRVEPPPPPADLEFASPIPESAEPVRPPPANAELAGDVVERVKRATVLLRVTLPDRNLAQGSGFFAVAPQIVLTNAHVIGMLDSELGGPRKIEVVQNSGTREERSYPARVLAVDRQADLAVLRVEAKNLPQPLEVKSAGQLRETQRVWIVGFPFGDGLGKEITVSSSSVSSLRREPNGILSRVQVNGGMHPGNSGGPVVDAFGDVVGVAVSALRGTQINFAVPGDYVRLILNGRIANLYLFQPIRKDGTIHAMVALRTIDPLRQMRQLALEVWTGPKDLPKLAPSTQSPAARKGETPRRHLAMDQRGDGARADVELPPLPAGQVYWVQPSWRTPEGAPRFATGQVWDVPEAVEPRAVQLRFHPEPGSRRLVLNSWLNQRMHDQSRGDHVLLASTQTEFTESIDPAAKDETVIHLRYQSFNTSLRVDQQVAPPDPRLRRLRREINHLQAKLHADARGTLEVLGIDLSSANINLREPLTGVHRDIVPLLECIAMPFPNREVQPGESWAAERGLPVRVAEPATPAVLGMQYTYLGVRQREGRQEAVVSLSGRTRPRKDDDARVVGRAEGTMVIDLGDGQVAQVQAQFPYEMDLLQRGRAVSRASGTLIVHCRRSLPKKDGD